MITSIILNISSAYFRTCILHQIKLRTDLIAYFITNPKKNHPESIHYILESTKNLTLKEKNLNSQKFSISVVIKANTVQCLEINLVITV